MVTTCLRCGRFACAACIPDVERKRLCGECVRIVGVQAETAILRRQAFAAALLIIVLGLLGSVGVIAVIVGSLADAERLGIGVDIGNLVLPFTTVVLLVGAMIVAVVALRRSSVPLLFAAIGSQGAAVVTAAISLPFTPYSLIAALVVTRLIFTARRMKRASDVIRKASFSPSPPPPPPASSPTP